MIMPTTTCRVGMRSKRASRLPESWRPSAAPSSPTTRARMPTTPCGTRRAPSSPQATACEIAVEVATHSSTITCALTRATWGPRREGGAAEQHPGLQQPGDVERRQDQCAQVVRGRADREDRGGIAVDQLPAASRGRGRHDPEREERGQRGRQQEHDVEGLAGSTRAGQERRQRGRRQRSPRAARRLPSGTSSAGVPPRRGSAPGGRRRRPRAGWRRAVGAGPAQSRRRR